VGGTKKEEKVSRMTTSQQEGREREREEKEKENKIPT